MWAEKVGRMCTMQEARTLRHKFLCRDHFLPTDFTTPEGIRLNRSAVPLGLDSASHSIPQSSPPMFPTLSNPQPSAVSPQNSNLPVLPPLPLTSELTEEENSLLVLPPLRTYSKLRLSTRIETSSYPHGRSLHFLSNLCTKSYTSSSQHIFCERYLLVPELRFFHCFWWGIQVLQWPKFFLEA